MTAPYPAIEAQTAAVRDPSYARLNALTEYLKMGDLFRQLTPGDETRRLEEIAAMCVVLLRGKAEEKEP